MKTFVFGTYKRIHPGQEIEYKSFNPTHINRAFVAQDQSTIMLLEEATRFAWRTEYAYSRLVPDIDFFIQMHVKLKR